MQNINLNNNYISQTSFKNKDNRNNYDILKQKLINNEIFEMRENIGCVLSILLFRICSNSAFHIQINSLTFLLESHFLRKP